MNTLAPTKDDLNEHPEGHLTLTHRYLAFCDNAYYTAFHWAYNLRKKGDKPVKAWDWYLNETSAWLRNV